MLSLQRYQSIKTCHTLTTVINKISKLPYHSCWRIRASRTRRTAAGWGSERCLERLSIIHSIIDYWFFSRVFGEIIVYQISPHTWVSRAASIHLAGRIVFFHSENNGHWSAYVLKRNRSKFFDCEENRWRKARYSKKFTFTLLNPANIGKVLWMWRGSAAAWPTGNTSSRFEYGRSK